MRRQISIFLGQERLRGLTWLRRPMVCSNPRLHSIQIAIAYDKYKILCPQGGFCSDMSYVHVKKDKNILLRKPASAITVDTPLKLSVPSPSPVLLSHDALITMASVPDALGGCNTAYALVPPTVFIQRHVSIHLVAKTLSDAPLVRSRKSTAEFVREHQLSRIALLRIVQF